MIEDKPGPDHESDVLAAAPPSREDRTEENDPDREKLTPEAERALSGWIARYAERLRSGAVDIRKHEGGDQVQKVYVDRAAQALEPQVPEPPKPEARLPKALNYFGGAFLGAGVSLFGNMFQTETISHRDAILTFAFTIVGAWLAPGVYRGKK